MAGEDDTGTLKANDQRPAALPVDLPNNKRGAAGGAAHAAAAGPATPTTPVGGMQQLPPVRYPGQGLISSDNCMGKAMI